MRITLEGEGAVAGRALAPVASEGRRGSRLSGLLALDGFQLRRVDGDAVGLLLFRHDALQLDMGQAVLEMAPFTTTCWASWNWRSKARLAMPWWR